MNSLKKIYHEIINIFKALVLTILGFFIKPQKKDNKIENNINQEDSTETSNGGTKITNISSLPDEDNIKANPHNETDATDSIILELPKTKIEALKNKNIKTIVDSITQEYLIKLIEDRLEKVYEDQKLEIKKVDLKLEKRIKEFEEKVLPKIEKEVNFYHLKKEDEIKKVVEIKVEDELKEFPILPPLTIEINSPTIKKDEDNILKTDSPKEITNKSNQDSKDEIYSIAQKIDKPLNFNETPKVKQKPIISVEDTIKIKENIEKRPTSMIKTNEDIPKPSITDTIKNTAAVATIIAAKTATEILTPDKKMENPDSKQITQENQKEKLQTIEKQITEERLESKTELEKVKAELEEKVKEIESEIKETEKKQEPEKDKVQEEVKDKANELIRDVEIDVLKLDTDSAIADSKEEMEKDDFFDKDYDRIEAQINKMLDDIENTRLRYGNKLNQKQKDKLKHEEDKLREAKDNIYNQKNKDIDNEKRELDNLITPDEFAGLEQELKRIDKQNKEEVNKELLRKMDKLEGMTAEEVENVDKRILFKRLNKASILMEMGSILAFPFIRNRYFFYFTAGLIINNHFNFLNAFWHRKVRKYEPADLSAIKQGQDALNGALDITFQNLVELENIEHDALMRYPELANDPRFINQVTNLRIKLNNNYNKLMRKNKIMEQYYKKSKKQAKILRKDLQKN